MIRPILLLPFLLVSCSPSESDEAVLPEGLWTAGERGGLCIAEEGRAAFILYAQEGDSNCMAQGKVEAEGDNLLFKPRGDDKCEFALSVEGDRITFGPATESCSYYCGGEVSLAGRAVNRSDAASGALVDPVGDSIC